MKLSEVLPESAIRLDVGGFDKWRLIEELCDSLVSSGQLEQASRDGVLEALVSREKSMSTGMEAGIAISHTSVSLVPETANQRHHD